MNVSIKRLVCYYLRDKVEEGAKLNDLFKALTTARVEENLSGKTLISTMSEGKNVTFTIPQGLTPSAMIEIIVELRDLFETIKPAFPEKTDIELINLMLSSLNLTAVTEFETNFTNLRIGGL